MKPHLQWVYKMKKGSKAGNDIVGDSQRICPSVARRILKREERIVVSDGPASQMGAGLGT